MYPLPPLRQLQAFEAAARLLSFKKAAEELSVTPTAISHQIRLLEEFCGHPLFVRRPRPLELSPSGARLLPIVSHALASIARELEGIRGETGKAELKITTTNAFAANWLVPRLGNWRHRYPHVGIEVFGTYDVMNLRKGEADVAIRYARARPADGESIEIARDEFYMVASPGLVDGLPLPITTDNLSKLPLIEFFWPANDSQAPVWRNWERYEREAGRWRTSFSAKPAMRFYEELHGLQAIVRGQGVGLCSNILVEPELRSGALVRLSDFSMPGYGFHVVWLADHSKRREIERFALWASEQAGSTGALPA
ncbi:LysR substrate-binding domain-containing protein [Frigidibacter sp. RF13]|uniref:LysR substrate-binding domain-containing protein n=1 Tax=Frigidibacter sp. RF13 TaxID=2997340 RepID=UPI002271DE39|nr:LysR substrate-binding domain-containing protein [Frigidibacter sp. RF13]MCY1127862.1 LysR substrate-binding domain-containing protein [Frigidibacter sp. RF13]